MFNMFLERSGIHSGNELKKSQKNDVTAEEAINCVKRIEIRFAQMSSSAQEFEKVV